MVTTSAMFAGGNSYPEPSRVVAPPPPDRTPPAQSRRCRAHHPSVTSHSRFTTTFILVVLALLAFLGAAEAPEPSHMWDLRGCNINVPVEDTNPSSSLTVTGTNGAKCTDEGMVFDGYGSWAFITPWRWGGVTSIEVLVKYNSFNYASRIFDFGSGAGSDNVYLANEKNAPTIIWSVRQGSTYKGLHMSNFDSATWTHVTVTVKGSNMKVYKNGALVGTNTDGHEPNVLTRTNHIIGASNWGGMKSFFNGTIAYLKIWHDTELTQTDVATLPIFVSCTTPGYGVSMASLSCEECLAGSYSPGGSACLPCPVGKYSGEVGATTSYTCEVCEAGTSSSEGSSSCSTCEAGTYGGGGTVCLRCPDDNR